MTMPVRSDLPAAFCRLGWDRVDADCEWRKVLTLQPLEGRSSRAGGTMQKVDLKREVRELYATGKRSEEPHLVTVPPINYIMADGTGDPNTSAWYKELVGALYAVSYGAKFAAKERGNDVVVMPLEGLWWSEPPEAFATIPRNEWRWTIMIAQAQPIDESMVRAAADSALGKGKIEERAAEALRFEALHEGQSAQVLHVGSYDAEAPLIARLHEWVAEQGFVLDGKHHEIYMSDPRRVAKEKLKTIIRYPVARA
jgi:hypothetical protein